MTPTPFTNVFFEFVSAAHGLFTGRGTVIVREDAMVLEIDSTGTNYHLVGRACEHYFAARSGDVSARWASIGDAYIGKWVEDGEVWVFYFSLAAPITRCLSTATVAHQIQLSLLPLPSRTQRLPAKTPSNDYSLNLLAGMRHRPGMSEDRSRYAD